MKVGGLVKYVDTYALINWVSSLGPYCTLSGWPTDQMIRFCDLELVNGNR